MFKNSSYVVVGANSLVGGALIKVLQSRGYETYGTTRRADQVSKNMLFLDFADPESYRLPVKASHAVIVAAATNYERCETDPLARKINTELSPQLIESLLSQGVFITFISTNSVFGGDRPWPNEDDSHDARIAYAIQKHEAEERAKAAAESLNALDRFSVVRLTKILSLETSPLPFWFRSWKEGKAVEPFADLIFAPMSLDFVGQALAEIAVKNVPGNLHLSGAENVNYVELAKAFASALGVDSSMIVPSSATAKGIHIAFKPVYSGLGMQRTTQLTGIHPQPLERVVADLIHSFRL